MHKIKAMKKQWLVYVVKVILVALAIGVLGAHFLWNPLSKTILILAGVLLLISAFLGNMNLEKERNT